MGMELADLPRHRQDDLRRILLIIFDEFDRALATATQPWKKAGRILKIVLYGSHGRGGPVDNQINCCAPDYDILIVVNDERLTDFVNYWSMAEDRLLRESTIGGTLGAPVNLIVHSMTDVNKALEHGRPFFIDIVKEGISLYAAEGFPFVGPRQLPAEEAQAEAQTYFNNWLTSAEAYRASSHFLRERGNLNEAAFNLHQAVERLYHCILLVLTLYSPKSHKLNLLRSLAEGTDPRLREAWPRSTKFELRCFELLRRSYVSARYSRDFRITEHELDWLQSRTGELQRLVSMLSKDRISGRK